MIVPKQNAGATATQSVKSKRDLTLEKLKARHPDVDYPDDESIYGAINEDYDEDQKQLGQYKENEKTFSDMFLSNPKAASFLQSWRKGEHPVKNLVREYGDEFMDYLTDPANADEIAEAQEEYLQKISDGNKLQEDYEKNMEASMAVFNQFDEEFGEEVTNELIGKLFSVANDVIQGKFTKEALDMFRLAASHDEDVAQAAHEGEVKGRNANIGKRLKLRKKSDGTANLGSSGADSRVTDLENERMGALGRMGRKRNIYEAGNEKRIKMN